MSYESDRDREQKAFKKVLKGILAGVGGLLLVILLFSSYTVVEPGNRGVKVTMGSTDTLFLSEGVNFKNPLSSVTEVSIRQQTHEMKSECYSSDLQQVTAQLKVLYRIPEAGVVTIFKNYSGSPFDSLIAPRMNEALKEVTALKTAEQIVKTREEIKSKALELARKKIGNLVVVEDLVIENLDLSKDLENAIESKMVQQQEAAKATYLQQKAEIEAKTATIRAQGEASAISIRGKAIRENPGIVDLTIAEKWDGHAPLVVGGGKGANVLLPLKGAKGE